MKPRLHKIDNTWMAVQIVPDVIELFGGENHLLDKPDTLVSFHHQCQVKWVDGQVVAPHGGLPLEALRRIFQENWSGRIV